MTPFVIINWQATDWEVVSAIAAVVSAIAAAVAATAAAIAIIQARRLHAETQVAGDVARQSSYFRALISRPISNGYDVMRRRALEKLNRGRDTLRGLLSGAQADVDRCLGKIIDEFNGFWYDLRDSIAVGTGAWTDSDLTKELVRAAQDLQDDVNEAVERLPRNLDDTDFRKILNEYGSAIRRIIMEHDPGIRAAQQRSPR